MTAKGIHELLPGRHAGDEPPVPGHGASANYPGTRGIAPGTPAAEAHPRFETEPGRQLQFDWKEGVAMHDRSGAEYRFDVHASTLGFSRMHYFVRSPTRTRDDLPARVADNVRWLGGVPRQWPAGDMSAVATFGGDGRRSRDRRARAFAREAGSGLVLCRPRTPQTKGRDESANRFPARLRAYEGDLAGWDGPGAGMARVCRRSDEEPNRTTGLPPELLFRREKEVLGPLPRDAVLSALVGEVSWQVVPPTMLAGAAGREFSVPRGCVGHRAGLLLVPGGQPGACDGGDLVATHDTTAQGGPVACREGDYPGAMADKRWGGTDADTGEQARRNPGLLGRPEGRLHSCSHLSPPVVDEVGHPGGDERGADLPSQLVSRRYERRSTIVTTNVGVGSWAKVFGDPVVASAIADRLCHHCHMIRITGRSHGTKDLAPLDRASPGREGTGSGAAG